MSTAGICAGYFTCYATIHIDSSISWRLPFIIQAIVAVILALSCYFLPKSPRWLLQNGRRDEALVEMERLEIPRLEAEKDILQSIGHHHPSTSAWRGFLSIFEPQYRRRTILGLFILGMMQLSGIDGILYVSLAISHAITSFNITVACKRICAKLQPFFPHRNVKMNKISHIII